MEKFFKNGFLAVMLMIFSGLCLSSCKDDDKDSPDSPLVGTWVSTYEDETVTLIFNSDGTGREIFEYYDERESEPFTWSATATIITFTYSDGDSERCTYSISSDGKTLFLDGDAFYKR